MRRAHAGLGFSLFLGSVLLSVSACSGAANEQGTNDDEALTDLKKKDAGVDSGTKDSGTDAGKDAGKDSGTSTDSGSGSGDGTPTRGTCTSKYGSGLSGKFGRLDGYITSVVMPGGSKSCNADSTHIHMQVSIKGVIYDVAVNIDGGYLLEKDIPLPGEAWNEGWHGSETLDYVKTLDLSSTAFTKLSESVLESEVEAAIASANHISVYGTTYTGSDAGSGIHDIHRQATNEDGAIFLDPTTGSPHALLFRFSSDSF